MLRIEFPFPFFFYTNKLMGVNNHINTFLLKRWRNLESRKLLLEVDAMADARFYFWANLSQYHNKGCNLQ